MYIYQTGLIGEAVRAKIENTKSAVMSGTHSTESFTDILRSMMTDTSKVTKAVGISGTTESSSPIATADGKTLLYALTNADSDTTAAAVVGALGLPISDNNLKAAADGLTSAINLLNAAEGADKETLIPVITDLVDKYNSLMTGLTAQSTASGIMYTRLFKTAAQTASEPLAKAGITADDTGKLTFDPNKFEEQDISGFISTVSSAANAVSTYASSVTGSQNGTLLDFLSGDEDSDSSYVSTSNYYNSLINSLM
ncbi:MAG: hypothetical protein II820_01575 [Ruminiclostridium sp.]|nr:hypothetical protein [Ruminiclostridium sp.]